MEWTSGSLITLVATTGVLSALLTQALITTREWFTSSREKRARAGYHALRLAVLLEAYAYDCASFITKNGNAQTPPDEEFPAWDVTLPKLPQYPDDVQGWHAIDIKLATRALNLQNRINGSQGMIDSTIEFVEDELGDTLDEEAGGLGLEAWNLAIALRKKYGLEPVELPWDFVETMERALQSAQKTKMEARKKQLEIFAAG